MKKVIALALAMLMLLGTMVSAALAEDTTVPFKETVTINLVMGTNEPFHEGETYEDNVWTRWVKNEFNVDLKYYWATTTNAYIEKLRLDLASGGKLPDVLYLGEGEKLLATELMRSGLFREVKTLFDEYAGETWKNAMYGEPDIFLPYTIDGQLMAVPVLEQNMNTESVMGIRGDWLEKLGLEVPKTIDELELVLDAFTNQDPDGNGVKDTYGLVTGLSGGLVNNGGDLGPIFGMYGTLNTYWNDFDGSAGLEYGSVQPGAKLALERLAKWFKSGYMNPECALVTGYDSGEEFAQGKGGVYFATRYAFTVANKVSENIEGAKLTIAPLPVGEDGTVIRHGVPSRAGCMLINKDFKDPEAYFRVQDWLFTYYADPQLAAPASLACLRDMIT